MTCALEVYDICVQRGTSCVMVHTNLGYGHYYQGPTVLRADGLVTHHRGQDWRGLLRVIAWQSVHGGLKRRARYDSWLRDGPPECVKTTEVVEEMARERGPQDTTSP